MANNPTKDGNFKEIDATQSTEWGLRCLSHQTNVLTFELQNVKTKRVHKLIFSGGGTDDISEPSVWTEGLYPLYFTTKFPANFENFDGALSILTPGGNSSDFYHLLRIGLLATINIAQGHGNGFGKWYLYGFCRIEYGSGERKSQSEGYYSGGYDLKMAKK